VTDPFGLADPADDATGPIVCHVSTANPAFDTRIFQRECRSLAKAGYRVRLVIPHEREEVVNGVHLVPLPLPKSRLGRRTIWPQLAARRAAGTRAELYHFHDPELMPAMEALHHLTGKPVIWDAHEVYTQTIPHFNQLGWEPASVLAGRLFDRYELAACRRSFAGVVTITELMAQRYRDAGIPTAVVENLVEDELLRPEDVSVPEPADPPLVITTGLLSEDRGILLMVAAFALVRKRLRCRLAFWGHFPREEDRDRLLDFVRQRGVEQDVFIGGPYPRRELLDALLPSATIGCVLLMRSSDYNALAIPNRLTEYWARGLPVITSDRTYAASMTREANAGIITDNTPEDLAACFERLLCNPSARRTMGENGRRAVTQRFNWNHAFANLLELYRTILPAPVPSPLLSIASRSP
jgi:glycosyltransferase involved in cell wall biosynthesis